MTGNVATYASSTVTFTVTVTNDCSTTVIYPESIADQTYSIGDPPLSINFQEWTESIGSCGVFTYTATYENGTALDNSFITFSSPTRLFEVSSNELSLSQESPL